MNVHSLLYHDVFVSDRDETGFPGTEAARYKLSREQFEAHLDALEAIGTPAWLAGGPADRGWALTFDDGGKSALTVIADCLERRGWRGHFFVTCDMIGTPTFLDETGVRELAARGHVVGSHSCSHPRRMAACTRDELADEWARSRERLGGILGSDVTVASIPGGYYSRAVAEEAARAGYRHLFTSEPVSKSWRVDGCELLGRYNVLDSSSPVDVARLARGSVPARLRQYLHWNAKKALKTVGGEGYVRLRRALLARRDG